MTGKQDKYDILENDTTTNPKIVATPTKQILYENTEGAVNTNRYDHWPKSQMYSIFFFYNM